MIGPSKVMTNQQLPHLPHSQPSNPHAGDAGLGRAEPAGPRSVLCIWARPGCPRELRHLPSVSPFLLTPPAPRGRTEDSQSDPPGSHQPQPLPQLLALPTQRQKAFSPKLPGMSPPPPSLLGLVTGHTVDLSNLICTKHQVRSQKFSLSQLLGALWERDET